MDTRHKIIVTDKEYWKIQELFAFYKTKNLIDILNKIPGHVCQFDDEWVRSIKGEIK